MERCRSMGCCRGLLVLGSLLVGYGLRSIDDLVGRYFVHIEFWRIAMMAIRQHEVVISKESTVDIDSGIISRLCIGPCGICLGL